MKIILPHDHEHSGVMRRAGEEMEFTEAQYAWFIEATTNMRAGDRKAMANIPGSVAWGEALLEEAKKAEADPAQPDEPQEHGESQEDAE